MHIRLTGPLRSIAQALQRLLANYLVFILLGLVAVGVLAIILHAHPTVEPAARTDS